MGSATRSALVATMVVGSAAASACLLTTSLDHLADEQSTGPTPEASAPCTVGLQISCPCLGGGEGVQICRAEGAFGPCLGCADSSVQADSTQQQDAQNGEGEDTKAVDSQTVPEAQDGQGGSAGAPQDSGFETGEDGAGGVAGTGGTVSTGGTAGSAGDSGTAGSGGTIACPPTAGGPPLVLVPAGFCIGATEVTNEQYSDWLATYPSTANQPDVCKWNTSFTPSANWPPSAAQLDLPVVYVDWCDAYAYCEALGVHLCGALGGGPGNYAESAIKDPALDQWMNACTSGGVNAFPYGNAFNANICNNDNGGTNALKPVGEMQQCVSSVSGYQGVYDLSGNAREWENACNPGEKDHCRIRGGAFVDEAEHLLRCDSTTVAYRDNTLSHVGIRCCAL